MELLAVPVKRTSEVDLVKGLTSVIASAYSSADNPADFSDAIKELHKLRQAATTRAFDRSESSLDVLYQYYDQLTALDAKILSSEVLIYFKWKNALGGGSGGGASAWLLGGNSVTMASFGFERACVLFNIGALQSQVASAQAAVQGDDNALRQATRLMKLAANTFAHLNTFVAAALANQQPTSDLRADTLTALSCVMLAQTQELFVLKAVRDAKNAALVAKLAAQCYDYYAEAGKALQRDTVRGVFDKDWLASVTAKRCAYAGHAEFYQSQVCAANQSVGEQIARLRQAEQQLHKAVAQLPAVPGWQSLSARSKKLIADALHDNNLIYHEAIPDFETLAPVGRCALAKIQAIAEPLSGGGHRDLFASLTPMAVQQAVASYEVRRAALVSGEVARLGDATQTLHAVLASLNLPAAIEDQSSCGTQPPASVRQSVATIREAGGLPALETMIAELPSLLQRNNEILTETERMLSEEHTSDREMRAKFSEKWTRTESDKLTESFRHNCAKYRQIIGNAVHADTVIRQKLADSRESLLLLSGSDRELTEAIARAGSGSSAATAGDSSSGSAAGRLHQLMDSLTELRTRRDQLTAQLKSPTAAAVAQIKSTLMAAGGGGDKDGGAAADSAAAVDQLLHSVYDPLSDQVTASLREQEQLLERVREAHALFSQSCNGNSDSARTKLLSSLTVAYNVFVELRANLNEGNKFYNDLTQVLLNLQTKVSDFCFARKTEKEELLKDLTSSLAKAGAQDVSALSQSLERTSVSTAAATTTPSTAPSLPYPVYPQSVIPQPCAPYSYYTPMPFAFNPYATFPGAAPAQPSYNYPQPYPYPGQQQQQRPQ